MGGCRQKQHALGRITIWCSELHITIFKCPLFKKNCKAHKESEKYGLFIEINGEKHWGNPGSVLSIQIIYISWLKVHAQRAKRKYTNKDLGKYTDKDQWRSRNYETGTT